MKSSTSNGNCFQSNLIVDNAQTYSEKNVLQLKLLRAKLIIRNDGVDRQLRGFILSKEDTTVWSTKQDIRSQAFVFFSIKVHAEGHRVKCGTSEQFVVYDSPTSWASSKTNPITSSFPIKNNCPYLMGHSHLMQQGWPDALNWAKDFCRIFFLLQKRCTGPWYSILGALIRLTKPCQTQGLFPPGESQKPSKHFFESVQGWHLKLSTTRVVR